ncbi:unnamed protein product [Miscanthus lutarioriparius]|uniref:Uncharacterized protein n=1 Tax=Miscanthus lutarioriparius TaxID=422564 RepID=A0A811NEN6_9POAL|nr:unnamed protein product [Miscanthus lutarioriparius]
MESAYFSVLTEQHSPSSFCHLKFHTQCHLDFLEMKLRVGLTQHTYPTLGSYVFQGETRSPESALPFYGCSLKVKVGNLLHLLVSKDFQIIKEDGKLKNSASPFPGLTLNATGNIGKKGSGNTFTVSMKGAVQVGGLQFPLDAQGEFVMEILYIDNKIRISRLNQHMLVHLRITNT